MTDLIRPALYSAEHLIVPVQESDEPARVQSVVGPVCESGDFLGENMVDRRGTLDNVEHCFTSFSIPSQGCSPASLSSWRLVGSDGHRRLWGINGKVRFEGIEIHGKKVPTGNRISFVPYPELRFILGPCRIHLIFISP